MTDKLRWGIIGTGNIAKAFARGVQHSETGVLQAVGSRSQASADKFAQDFQVPTGHPSYQALLADPMVQAVYIATPHPLHPGNCIAAARAGKHILCEKPIALNAADAMAAIEAARRNDVFLMEAFMYRCHPQTAKLVELIRAKTIGEVRMIRATFGFHAGFKEESRLFANSMGGGGILDVGCYATSVSRLIAGAATGKDFAEPIDVSGAGHLGASNVDEWACATLRFPGDIIAQCATSVSLSLDNQVTIFGSEGQITVPSPWFCSGREGGKSVLLVQKRGQTEEVVIETPKWLYAIEADTVAANLAKRQAPSPAMSWDDTLGNMKTLDRWRAAIGLVYEPEKGENLKTPVCGEPLHFARSKRMIYGKIAGVDKPVARVVMGVDNQRDPRHAAVMFDDYFELGGNVFDTARIYGPMESVLGQWVANRGVRKDVVILDKGAHTPHCYPDKLTSQFLESLEQLRTDYVDIYMLHRDNEEVPVGEFIDALNEQHRAGRMRAFGGSNWSIQRVTAANEYAKKKGLVGFSAVSNNFSLARMVDPVWAGCIYASDPASRKWLSDNQFSLMPWSSQARGFFLEGKADPNDRSDAELARCWYSPDNFQRRERAFELAKKKGVRPINIALAYVLCQPFPTFPLIGPRALQETWSSLDALDLTLSAQEVRWLNLEA